MKKSNLSNVLDPEPAGVLMRDHPLPKGQQFVLGNPFQSSRAGDLKELLRASAKFTRAQSSHQLDTLLKNASASEVKKANARRKFGCLLEALAILRKYPDLTPDVKEEIDSHVWYFLASAKHTPSNPSYGTDVYYMEVIQGKPRIRTASAIVEITAKDMIFVFGKN